MFINLMLFRTEHVSILINKFSCCHFIKGTSTAKKKNRQWDGEKILWNLDVIRPPVYNWECPLQCWNGPSKSHSARLRTSGHKSADKRPQKTRISKSGRTNIQRSQEEIVLIKGILRRGSIIQFSSSSLLGLLFYPHPGRATSYHKAETGTRGWAGFSQQVPLGKAWRRMVWKWAALVRGWNASGVWHHKVPSGPAPLWTLHAESFPLHQKRRQGAGA